MSNSIAQLTKMVPVLTAQDTLRRAASLIRSSDGSRLPVHDNGRVLGMVSERGIAAFIAASEDVESALSSPVGDLMDPNTTSINSSVSLKDAAGVFAATGEDMLPVIDNSCGFKGVLYRKDVVGSLTRSMRPPVVAGMATPLGVHLTTGTVSGGAGSLGLFLTGCSMALMIAVAGLIVDVLMRGFTLATGINVTSMLRSTPLATIPNFYDLPYYLTTALSIVMFFVLMRLSPLSGYHAAEHMTVHAIEAGEDLTLDTVRRMPRVHPRCGTNLLAAAGVFVIITSRFSSNVSVLVAMVVVVLGWRTIGGWLQYMVTTKKPSEKQLANGVAAGNELLAEYHENPYKRVTGLQRILSTGLPQTAAGMATVLWLMESVVKVRLF